MSLCTHIVERRMQIGDRLPSERELADTFAVSRNVVREAIAQLQWLGIVEVSHGRGTILATRPSPKELGLLVDHLDGTSARTPEESLEARTVFEAGLAELIVFRSTPDDITRLESILTSMSDRLDAGQPIGADDVAFHEALLRCTHNELLVSAGQRLVLGYLHSSISELDPTLLIDADSSDLPGHRKIIEAIRERDADRLRDLLRSHRFSRATNSLVEEAQLR